MTTGFTPPSLTEIDTSRSITAKETPPKLARIGVEDVEQNRNKEHIPVMCIQTPTAATLDETPAPFVHTGCFNCVIVHRKVLTSLGYLIAVMKPHNVYLDGEVFIKNIKVIKTLFLMRSILLPQ